MGRGETILVVCRRTMRTTFRSARLVISDPVPLRPAKALSPAILYWMFGAGAVVLGLVSISVDGGFFRAYIASLGVLSLLILLYLHAVIVGAVQGRIRVAEGGLRFVRTRSAATLPAALAAAGMIPGILSLVAPAWTGEVFGLSALQDPLDLFLGVVTLAGPVWLIQQAWALRLPPGLGVSALGLWGVRGGANLCLPWEDLDSASVVDSKTGARLVITSTVGSFTVQPYEIGSDPNLVAVIIEHFRTHPEGREALADADEAIRRVEAARA